MSERIACLETYCQVRENWRKNFCNDTDSLFSVEEDHKNRIYVQLVRGAVDRSSLSDIYSSGMQWRFTDAVGPQAKYRSLNDTLGSCVMG